MEKVEHLASVTDPMLACCLCKQLLQEAVLLTCLHNCCQKCFRSAIANGSCQLVACGSCGATTSVGCEAPNHFIDSHVHSHMSATCGSMMCDMCRENCEPEEPAVEWCRVCRLSFCEDCLVKHEKCKTQQATQSAEELSLVEGYQQPSTSSCAIHKAPAVIACRECQQTKCNECRTVCLSKKHNVFGIDTDSVENYLGTIVTSISSMEDALVRKSKALEEPRASLTNLKVVRDRHLKEIKQRKRRLLDVIEKVFEEIERSTNNAYDQVTEEFSNAIEAFKRMSLTMSDARAYVHLLIESNEKCAIINQQEIVQERLRVLSNEFDALDQKPRKAVILKVRPLPEELENIVEEWIGKPELTRVAAFGEASHGLQLPVTCRDVALTKDGCRLLAAAEFSGLIELSCSSRLELSRWLPPKYNYVVPESVLAVEALDDGRAAICLDSAQCIVLLRRSNIAGSDGSVTAAGSEAWIEDRRFQQLPWLPGRLSAHGDLLAVAEYSDGLRLVTLVENWLSGTAVGRRLRLLSLGSGQQLSSDRQREYSIRSLAVVADVVVTLSLGKVNRSDGRQAVQVLDAHSLLFGDERLWRLEVDHDEEEELCGICADSTSGCLYAAVPKATGAAAECVC